MSTILDTTSLLDRAEREYLFDGKEEFLFALRRPNGNLDFYQKLEAELQQQSLLKVREYRSVKEGRVNVSRPSLLSLSEQSLLDARPHLQLLRNEILRLTEAYQFINVNSFFRRFYDDCLADMAITRSCFDVFQYLLGHREKIAGLLPRQIPHGQSTKLIGKEKLLLKIFSFWREEPSRWSDFYTFFGLLETPAEFRFFAPDCALQGQRLKDLNGILSRDWIEQLSFQSLRGTLIVENIQTFYVAAKTSTMTLIVWGGGWKAAALREMFRYLPHPRYYWGDIDKEGYEIFGVLKRFDQTIQPLYMDQLTLDRHRSIQQKREIYLGPFQEVPGLQSEYEFVCRNGLQIEQEQLDMKWVDVTDP